MTEKTPERAPAEGRLVRSVAEVRRLFNLRPSAITRTRIRERQIASERAIERHEREVLL